MTEVELDFLKIIKNMVEGTAAAENTDTDWEKVFTLASMGKLLALLYDTVRDCKSIDPKMLKQWDHIKFQTFVRQKKYFYDLTKILGKLKENGIDYVLFKGDIVANAYSNPAYRVSADSDILVAENQYMAANEILKSSGYILAENLSKKGEYHYDNTETGHVIEIHTDIFGDYSNSHKSVLQECGIGRTDKAQIVMIQGYEFRTLEHTDHLIYQMYHIIKHFMLEGGCVRFFTDIILYIRHYGGEIDMQRFWEVIEKAGYGDFCANFFRICVDRFGADVSVLCKREPKASADDLDKMLEDFIYAGDTGGMRTGKYQMMSVMTPYFNDENNGGKVSFFKLLFPPFSTVAQGYKYVQKAPILLPVGWIHRLCKNVIIRIKSKRSLSARKELDWVQSRIELMRKLGL